MQGILGIQREADRQAMERDAMNMRGGMLRQEPGLMQRVGSQARRLFYGDRNLYGNDPLQPSVMDSQYVRPEMAEGAVLDFVGGPMATAWHGSPHLFKKFDMSKIGTGEGAQAYGHGLYFAENPETAQAYKDMLRPLTDIEDLRVGGIPLYRQGQPVNYSPNRGAYGQWIEKPTEDDYARAVLQEDMLINEWKFKDAFDKEGLVGARKRMREVVSDRLQSAKKEWPESVPFLESTLAKLDKDIGNKMKFNEYDSYLYKVDIPDEHIDKMLDWDKPMREQPQVLQKMAKTFDLSRMKEGNRTRVKLEKWRSGKEQEHDLATGHEFYNALSDYGQESTEELSRKLSEAGISGIKYLDQGSRGAGKGTHNFVVFNDQIPQILEINDKPVRGVLSGQ